MPEMRRGQADTGECRSGRLLTMATATLVFRPEDLEDPRAPGQPPVQPLAVGVAAGDGAAGIEEETGDELLNGGHVSFASSEEILQFFNSLKWVQGGHID